MRTPPVLVSQSQPRETQNNHIMGLVSVRSISVSRTLGALCVMSRVPPEKKTSVQSTLPLRRRLPGSKKNPHLAGSVQLPFVETNRAVLAQMLPWDLSRLSVTPAASALARCVSRGALSQEALDSATSRPSPAFSPHLHEAEQRIRTQRQLDQLQLEMQLLLMEKQDADVTHAFYLTQRFQVVQIFCSHLQDILKNQACLRQRLMRPLGRTNLPIQAELHRSVVDSVKLLLDFIATLEEKLKSVHSWTKTRDLLAQLDNALAQLLAQVVELQTLSSQVLQWREVSSSLRSDGSA